MKYYLKKFLLIQGEFRNIVFLVAQFFIKFFRMVFKKAKSANSGWFFKKVIKFFYPALTIYLTLFAIGITRYELSLVSLNSKISNLLAMSEGGKAKYALERVPQLQYATKMPVEPKIDNPTSILKSIHHKYDDLNYSAYEDLYEIIKLNKNNLNNLNLSGLILPSIPTIIPKIGGALATPKYDLSEIVIENVKFTQAKLFAMRFEHTEFINVDFFLAELLGANFSFAIFKNSDLTNANLQASTLCGVQFINTSYINANFKEANLVGADLSNMLLNSERFKPQPDLQGAVYNSARYNFMSGNLDKFNIPYAMYASCGTDYFPPTKFPKGFDPERHGMINISKL